MGRDGQGDPELRGEAPLFKTSIRKREKVWRDHRKDPKTMARSEKNARDQKRRQEIAEALDLADEIEEMLLGGDYEFAREFLESVQAQARRKRFVSEKQVRGVENIKNRGRMF